MGAETRARSLMDIRNGMGVLSETTRAWCLAFDARDDETLHELGSILNDTLRYVATAMDKDTAATQERTSESDT